VPSRDLSYRQRLFLVHYLAGESAGNATDAARRAGYRKPRQAGSRLLSHVAIRAAIRARLERFECKIDDVLRRLVTIARADITDFIALERGGQGWRIDLRAARAQDLTAAIRKIEPGPDGPQIELCDPLKALELLGRFHGRRTGPERRQAQERLELRRQELGCSDPSAVDRPAVVAAAGARAADCRQGRAEGGILHPSQAADVSGGQGGCAH